MGKTNFQYDESGTTFYYVLLTFLGFILIPSTYYFWPEVNTKKKFYEMLNLVFRYKYAILFVISQFRVQGFWTPASIFTFLFTLQLFNTWVLRPLAFPSRSTRPSCLSQLQLSSQKLSLPNLTQEHSLSNNNFTFKNSYNLGRWGPFYTRTEPFK